MKFLIGVIWLCSSLFAQEVPGADSTSTTAQDSLAALLAEPILDSVVVSHGDSLFLPVAGRSRIVRDRYGVPHVYGETDVDVSFGFGYAQAEDHLIPMLLSYRMAKGEAAEILGHTLIESDFKSRMWRVGHLAGEQYGSIPESTRDRIGGFVDGVNHYIDIHEQTLPAWVKPIRGIDVVASARWLTLLFAEASGTSELRSKGIEPTLGSVAASNQMLVAPEKSATQTALSISDVHLPWQIPFRMYEAHLKSQEGLNVSGATFFGWPALVLGHNERITWSFTTNDADIFDLYEEKLDPSNPKRYLFEREKQRLSTRRERIKVRGRIGVEEVERELQYSHHGPIYKVIDNWAYAARTSVEDVTDLIGQLFEMNKATDLRSFRASLARLQLPMFNAMYGDVDGNTYYVFLSRTPIRAEKFDWRNVVPGWTKETDWGGILPFSQLPQMINPNSGFLQNCNTPPDAVSPGANLDRTNFPGYLGWGRMNDRGRRTLTWLSSRPTVSLADALSIVRDEYLLEAEEWKALIFRAYNRSWQELYDPDFHVAQAITLLRDWDDRASVDSRAVALFTAWKTRYRELLAQLAAEQSQDVRVLERLALEALQGSVAYLVSTFGRVDVAWGEIHQVTRGERGYPVGGSPPGMDALHRLWSSLQPDGTYRVYGGSAFTSVTEMTYPPTAYTALPFGNSEDPKSAHYADQAELQTRNQLKRTWVLDDDVLANARRIKTVPFEDDAMERERLRAWWRHRNAVAPSPEPASADSSEAIDSEM